jgi:hypothetical protein
MHCPRCHRVYVVLPLALPLLPTLSGCSTNPSDSIWTFDSCSDVNPSYAVGFRCDADCAEGTSGSGVTAVCLQDGSWTYDASACLLGEWLVADTAQYGQPRLAVWVPRVGTSASKGFKAHQAIHGCWCHWDCQLLSSAAPACYFKGVSAYPGLITDGRTLDSYTCVRT